MIRDLASFAAVAAFIITFMAWSPMIAAALVQP